MASQKIYILDTNVLIHDPESLTSFSDALVGIPITVLEELDKFKAENSQRGRSARDVIRALDLLRSQGSLATGVHLENGGTLRVLLEMGAKDCPLRFEGDSPDNQILNIALCMQSNNYDVVFISKDINMRVKADVVGLKSLDYLKDIVAADHFYKGWLTVQVPAVQLKDSTIPKDLISLANDYEFSPNEYVLAESNHNEHNYKVFRYLGNKNFKYISPASLKWPIQPKNPQQLIALDLLLDDTIQFVTLLGPAGTGKTFLALVAGLHKLLIEQVYAKILVSRPVVPLGPDIGFLPGAIQDKLHSWMQPVYDNMDFIVHLAQAGAREHSSELVETEWQEDDYHNNGNGNGNGKFTKGRGEKEGRDKYKKFRKDKPSHGFPTLDELVRQGKISLEAITYMRGRSIPYQYIFIDEVQNLTPHEVKTIISRVGEGSKIILAGDPYQIDSPYLDFSSNGLMVASQKFKGQEIFGTAFLEISERSELSKLAGKLL